MILPFDRQPVKSSLRHRYVYVHIIFSWWDLAAEVCENVGKFYVEMASSCLKHMKCFISVHIEANATCCLLEIIP